LLHFLTDTDGRALAQVISFWLLTVHVWVQSQFILCEICGGQAGSVASVPPSTSVSSCQLPFH